MDNLLLILVWGFGVCIAAIMLGSLIRRRRESLVKSLREHVVSEIGETLVDEPEDDGKQVDGNDEMNETAPDPGDAGDSARVESKGD